MNKETKKNKKSWFARLMEKLDQKLEKKAKATKCDCNPDDKKDSSCC